MRSLLAWIARATISFPVPLSPWIRTVLRRAATLRMRSKISCMVAFLLTMSWKACLSASCRRRSTFSRWRLCTRSARSTSRDSSFGLHGLTRYSNAPSFMAWTAVSTVAYAVMITNVASGLSFRISRIVSMPSMPGGILRSSR